MSSQAEDQAAECPLCGDWYVVDDDRDAGVCRPCERDRGEAPPFESLGAVLTFADQYGTDGHNETLTGNDEWDACLEAMCRLAAVVRLEFGVDDA